MKALVKSKREPGLWLEDIEPPRPGMNDVLIRVRRAGICGTDVHIYKWDDWAQRTIPVPMAIGHEFVGEMVEAGSNVADFHSGRHRQRRRSRGVRALPQLPGRAPSFVRAYHGRGREPARRVRRIYRAADDQYLAARADGRSGYRRDFRSVRQRGAYRAVVSGAGRGRSGYRLRAHRPDGGRRREACRRALRGRDGHESVPAGAREEDGRDASLWTYRKARWRRFNNSSA